jgi:hypothetical protein
MNPSMRRFYNGQRHGRLLLSSCVLLVVSVSGFQSSFIARTPSRGLITAVANRRKRLDIRATTTRTGSRLSRSPTSDGALLQVLMNQRHPHYFDDQNNNARRRITTTLARRWRNFKERCKQRPSSSLSPPTTPRPLMHGCVSFLAILVTTFLVHPVRALAAMGGGMGGSKPVGPMSQ